MHFIRHPLQFAENTIYGDKVLSILQDQNTPLIDLLIRESVQNSLDAAIGPDAPVHISYDVRDIDTCDLLSMMELDTGSSKRLRDAKKLIEIRDHGTVGLTGEQTLARVTDTNATGNFLKLIFSLGVHQTKERSGGSWGLGKTVFFRPGYGFVIFYSKLQTGESRLAACWVEDQNKQDGFLKSLGIRTGVCWWGKNEFADGNRSYLDPFTAEHEIARILDCLGSTPFDSGQSGTAIIIPFLNDTFTDGLTEDAIRRSLQKWYFPRLFSTWKHTSPMLKSGPRLVVSINGTLLNPNDNPLYKIANNLHVLAVRGTLDETEKMDDWPMPPADAWYRREIKHSTTIIGWFAWTLVDGKMLGLTSGFPSPDEQLFCNPAEMENQYFPTGNRDGGGLPLVFMSRSPGMIVQYSTDKEWTGTLKVNAGQWFVAAFVVNSALPSIESYFRLCENAVHMKWAHPAEHKPNYLNHVQSKIRMLLGKEQEQPQEKQEKIAAFALGRRMAEIFMPRDGFGTRATIEPIVSGKSIPANYSSCKKTPQLQTSVLEYHGDNTVSLHFDTAIPARKRGVIEICVANEWGSMTMAAWQKEHGELPYPFKIVTISLASVRENSAGLQEKSSDMKKYGVKCIVNHAILSVLLAKSSVAVLVEGVLTFKMLSKDLSFQLESRIA